MKIDLVARLCEKRAREIDRYDSDESEITDLLQEAADRIEYLESVAGAVSQGDLGEFLAMKKLYSRASGSEPAKLKPEGSPMPDRIID